MVGVPLCILEDRVLEDIGSYFGVVVRKSSVELLETDSSFHLIGVLVDHGVRVQDVIFLKWRGKTFKI